MREELSQPNVIGNEEDMALDVEAASIHSQGPLQDVTNVHRKMTTRKDFRKGRLTKMVATGVANEPTLQEDLENKMQI